MNSKKESPWAKTANKKLNCKECKEDFLGYSIKQTRCPDCQAIYRNKRKAFQKYNCTCGSCGLEFRGSNNKAKYCDDCKYTGECKTCGESFSRESSCERYCSTKCRNISRIDYYYDGAWSKVMDRESWSCYKCGIDENLVVHHIDHSGSENIQTKQANNELSNLVVLCNSCHTTMHSEINKYILNKYMDEVISFTSDYLGDLPCQP